MPTEQTSKYVAAHGCHVIVCSLCFLIVIINNLALLAARTALYKTGRMVLSRVFLHRVVYLGRCRGGPPWPPLLQFKTSQNFALKKGWPRRATPTIASESRNKLLSPCSKISLRGTSLMPQFDFLNRRHNTLRLLGYDYNSTLQLCAITMVTDLRRPVFADVNLARVS